MNKELEALEYLFPCYHCKEKDHTKCEEICVEYIKYKETMSALKRKEKLEKAWEIVKEKRVDLSLLRGCSKYDDYNFNYVKLHLPSVYDFMLYDYDFNLLKEMLEEK